MLGLHSEKVTRGGPAEEMSKGWAAQGGRGPCTGLPPSFSLLNKRKAWRREVEAQTSESTSLEGKLCGFKQVS